MVFPVHFFEDIHNGKWFWGKFAYVRAEATLFPPLGCVIIKHSF